MSRACIAGTASMLLGICLNVCARAEDWPMLGRDGSRNSVSVEAIAGGRLYVRMDDQLFCYDVRQDAMGRSPTAASVIELLALHVDNSAENNASEA